MQNLSLQDRIKRFAERVRADAMALPEGDERTGLLLKADRMAGEAGSELVSICDRAGDRATIQ